MFGEYMCTCHTQGTHSLLRSCLITIDSSPCEIWNPRYRATQIPQMHSHTPALQDLGTYPSRPQRASYLSAHVSIWAHGTQAQSPASAPKTTQSAATSPQVLVYSGSWTWAWTLGRFPANKKKSGPRRMHKKKRVQRKNW